MKAWNACPVLVYALLLSCEPGEVPDEQPPLLLETQVFAESHELVLGFDEPLTKGTAGGDYEIEPRPPIVEGSSLKVSLPTNLEAGRPYQWRAQVEDARHNSTSVTGRFFGPNTHPAQMRLNEVRVAGSGNHKDLVELRVTTAGNLGGWTLEAWTSPTARRRIVFPDLEVKEGALVVVHYRPADAPLEGDELSNTASSRGPDCSPEAWDFWVPEAKGLSAVKGVLVLRPRPELPPADGFAYSIKPGESEEIALAAGWSKTGELSPEGCTATRTWCRGQDQDAGWMIVSTGKATPGLENVLIPWSGQPSSPAGRAKTKG